MTTGNTRPPRRKDGIDPVARSRARRRALQAIYAWQVSGGNATPVIEQFAPEQAHEGADLDYFEELVSGGITPDGDTDGKEDDLVTARYEGERGRAEGGD